MTIRKATACDIDDIMPIFEEARRTIAMLGIDQWQNGYPNREVVSEDVKLNRSYVLVKDGAITGTFALIEDGEPLYDKIENGHWISGDDNRSYNAVHRVAIAVSSRGSGAASEMLGFVFDMTKMSKKSSVRIDTHEGNRVMRRMLEKNGFTPCGTIHLENGDPRIAYERFV